MSKPDYQEKHIASRVDFIKYIQSERDDKNVPIVSTNSNNIALGGYIYDCFINKHITSDNIKDIISTVKKIDNNYLDKFLSDLYNNDDNASKLLDALVYCTKLKGSSAVPDISIFLDNNLPTTEIVDQFIKAASKHKAVDNKDAIKVKSQNIAQE